VKSQDLGTYAKTPTFSTSTASWVFCLPATMMTGMAWVDHANLLEKLEPVELFHLGIEHNEIGASSLHG